MPIVVTCPRCAKSVPVGKGDARAVPCTTCGYDPARDGEVIPVAPDMCSAVDDADGDFDSDDDPTAEWLKNFEDPDVVEE